MSLPPLIRESEQTDELWRRKVRDAVNGAMRRSLSQGATAERPKNPDKGTQHYDYTLEKPVWWNGTVWKDASGTVV